MTYSLLQTIAAAAADIVSSSGNVAITGCPTFAYEGISSLVRVPSVAETLQISTINPVAAAAAAVYSGYIKQYDIINNTYFEATFRYTATAADSVTTIATAIKRELYAYIVAGKLKVAITSWPSTPTASVILTALTRYPIFTFGLTSVGVGATPMTFTTGTPGVRSVNLAADVLLAYSKAGLPAPTLTGASYTSYSYRYAQPISLDLGNIQRNAQDIHTVFVDNTVGANYTNFNIRMVEVQLSYTAGSTTVPDPLLVSKPSVVAGAAEN